ncbi:MAG: methylated-DNA--[protein]-cysteine S-methyltransferase [Candidatus Bathyarchaeota archaeon]|nr:methylated-DNA--[protein]-cysteine S-methyltransferase [Candidatus Bathyarchaeota archaeon]
MIEIYSQNLGGVHFAVALSGGETVACAFSSHQPVALNSILINLPFNLPFQVFHTPTPHAQTLLCGLQSLYEGKDTDVDFCLSTADMPLYTQKVLHATMAIPVGYVTSYGAIAVAVGGGARAVGNAMACNRYPIVVPCHRVVKSDLGLGGYGAGGVGVKLEFLRRERRGYREPKEVAVDGGCLRVFPVEDVLAKYI